MVPKSTYVQLTDAQTLPGEEEYVLGMVQRQRNIHVVTKDVPNMLRKEEYV